MRGFLCSDVQVIAMCEGKAGSEAQVTKVPLLTLKVLRKLTCFGVARIDCSPDVATMLQVLRRHLPRAAAAPISGTGPV